MKIILSILIPVIAFAGWKAATENETVYRGTNIQLSAPVFNSINKSKSNNKGSEDCVPQDWQSEAFKNIKEEEYNISPSGNTGEFQSPNRSNNIRFRYYHDGFSAELRQNKIPLFDISDKMLKESEKKYHTLKDWKIRFRVNGLSKTLFDSDKSNDRIEKFQGMNMTADKNTASIEDGNMKINYSNSEDGMRQDFIVKKRPEGSGKLNLLLSAETKLKLVTGADALMFSDNKGEYKMKYSSLKVWDANGVPLRAYFEKTGKLQISNAGFQKEEKENQVPDYGNSHLFSIAVNDEEAVYPITIDPLSTSPSWTAEGNQGGANFGWSVATAGDVNGDGYSEVIVGAPYYDNGQTNEGRVFVYHGSAAGLSGTANWTKESNQSSASFGWSVATAGDVNGDGYSDVIIGSPYYDSLQTDEGRAYVYLGSASGLQTGYNWKYETNQSSENFGYTVGCAGDINNDGKSDIIAGSPQYDGGENNEGRVYVFTGTSIGLNANPVWAYESNQADASLGYSAATAGDVNGDGYSDVIVGIYKYNTSYSNDGRVYCFYSNGGSFPFSPSWTANGSQTGEYFGYSVNTAGDVNSDGYSDVIIGSPLYDNGQTDEGKAYVYPGSSAGISSSPVWTQEGGETGGQFGVSVSTAGDMNGDGYADIIAGANFKDNGQTDEGTATVFLGKNTGVNTTHAVIYEINQSGSYFGFSVATAGDVNGDGLSDVIIGAFDYDNPTSGEGAAFVYYGSINTLSTTASWNASGTLTGGNYGYSVSSAGDVNGDGYSDVIVSSPDLINGYTHPEKVYVFYGSQSGLSTTPDWSSQSDQSVSYYGTSVSTAGDVNGDGYSDIIIGAFLYYNVSTQGAAFVYLGSSSGLSLTPNWKGEGNQLNSHYGYSVSTAGDVNGDGFSDVIIGSPLYDNGQTNEGAAFLYYGSPTGLNFVNCILEGNIANSLLGSSVSSAGDVNGDGYSDVIAGALNYTNGQNNEGAAFVYYGSPTGLNSSAAWSAEGDQANANFGSCVSSAGDVNGDGYSDIITSASGYNGNYTDEGCAFVFYGSSSGLSATSDWSAPGNQTGATFGSSVSSAGDVNGDGYSDVIIGAENFDSTVIDEGAAYIYLGSASGMTFEKYWYVYGFNNSGFLGNCVSSAGDINGDGYSDFIAGAKNYSSKGSAFVYYGGSYKNAIKSNARHFKPGTSYVVASGCNTGTDGAVRLQFFAKSPFGKGTGKAVFELKENGIPFSGSIISNSTSYTSVTSFQNLGLAGINLYFDYEYGLNPSKVYKWRTRVQYKMTNFPFQKYGPWRYYSNYVPDPSGDFRPKKNQIILHLSAFIEGLYKSSSDNMTADTVRIYLRNSSAPYAIADSGKSVLISNGNCFAYFNNAVAGTPYYIVLKHRNSIETWSSSPQTFVSGSSIYTFKSPVTQAFGNNMKMIDNSPVAFGIYAGDINQDGTIDAADLSSTENDALTGLSGYVQTDLTGDDYVDADDLSLVENNVLAGVSSITP